MSASVVLSVPGSKSLTIRALAAAGLAKGRSTIEGPLVADDTRAALRAFRGLGAIADADGTIWEVEGCGGHPTPVDQAIDLGESGLTSRIVIAASGLVDGEVTLTARGRLPKRPMGGILDAMAGQGVSILSPPGQWPMILRGSGSLSGGVVEVDVSRTTQGLTGLLMVAPFANQPMILVPIGAQGSEGYAQLTIEVLTAFGTTIDTQGASLHVENGGLRGTRYVVEPDASAAVYPMVAAAITGLTVDIAGLGTDSKQPDMAVARHLAEMGCSVDLGPASTSVSGPGRALRPIDADLSACPDGATALAVASLFAEGRSRLGGLQSLRYKESDRLQAMAIELGRVGGQAEIDGDSLIVTPGRVEPVEVATYNDHRIAMSFGVLSLVEPGLSVDNRKVVSKTWPEYWDLIAKLRGQLV